MTPGKPGLDCANLEALGGLFPANSNLTMGLW